MKGICNNEYLKNQERYPSIFHALMRYDFIITVHNTYTSQHDNTYMQLIFENFH